jgi:hypothetical protein
MCVDKYVISRRGKEGRRRKEEKAGWLAGGGGLLWWIHTRTLSLSVYIFVSDLQREFI